MPTLRSSLSLSLFAISCSIGCSDDGSGTSATTSLTTNTNAGTEGPDTGDGDGDSGDGDGDSGDGDGDSGGGEGFCIPQCMSDDDCLINGMDVDLTCVDSICTGSDSGCTDDQECVALYSGWQTPCTAGGGECEMTLQVCIDVGGGSGLCATPPSDFIDCATLLMDEFQTVDIDGNPVTVCANLDAVCNDDNFCFVPCGSDADCVAPGYPMCNVSTGLCGCTSDADCATIGEPRFSVCNAGICGCGEDQQCIDANAGDVCTSAGFCGCSGDMACAGVENPYDGGTVECVPTSSP